MFSTSLRYLGEAQPYRETLLELGAGTCPVRKNNLVAVLAVFMVEFSYGLASPFMGLSVGKRWGQQPRDLGASLIAIARGLCSNPIRSRKAYRYLFHSK